MDSGIRQVEYRPQFFRSLAQIRDYLRQSSDENAIRFLKDLKPVEDKIALNPLSFPECRYLPTKRKMYRQAPYKRSYRIYYKVFKGKVILLDIRHEKRNPDALQELRKSK